MTAALATWWRRLRTNGQHRDDGEATALARHNEGMTDDY